MKRSRFFIALLIFTALPAITLAEEPIEPYQYDFGCELDGWNVHISFPSDFEETSRGYIYLVGRAKNNAASSRNKAAGIPRKQIFGPGNIRINGSGIIEKLNNWGGNQGQSDKSSEEGGRREIHTQTGIGIMARRVTSSGNDNQNVPNNLSSTESHANAGYSMSPRKMPKIDPEKTYIFEWRIIGNNAFEGLTDLTEVVLPSTVVSIWPNAFKDCKNLTKVVISNPDTSIGWGAFEGCTSLKEITLPQNLENIRCRTFCDCKSLRKLVIPDGVSLIEWNAFTGCTTLTEITLPNNKNIDKIGYQAFADCRKLTSVVIPGSVKVIDIQAFYGCESLKQVTLSDGLETIGYGAFAFSGIEQIVIPSSVKKISDYAFDFCDQLKSVNLSEGLQSMGDGAFCYCKKLEAVKLPNSLETMGSGCFLECGNLKSVYISSSLKRLEEMTFESCSSLTKVEFGSDSQLWYLGPSCFGFCSSLKEFDMPDKVTTLDIGINGEAVFMNTPIEHLKISASIINLPYMGINTLKTVTFAENSKLTTLEQDAFSYNSELESITLPEGLRKIGDLAFYNCVGLKTIVIPESVTDIGYSVFDNCKAVEDIYCHAKTPPEVYSNLSWDLSSGKFNKDFFESILHVPYGTAEKYAAAYQWNLFFKYGTVVEDDPVNLPADGLATAEGIMAIVNIISSCRYDVAADVNGDGKVDIADIIQIINSIMK